MNHTMHECFYTNPDAPDMKLSAEFHVPDTPAPLLLFFHGWHQTAESTRNFIKPLLAEGYFVISVDMRGRGKSSGKPDASGLELLDGVEALRFAREKWLDKIDAARGPYLLGGSGGGGNTMALAGKAPDLFAAAVSWAGMSDYALWHRDDEKGCYRDEMEGENWIGGTPETNKEAYTSRGGITLVENVYSPLLVMHGRNDLCVPFHHAENYKAKAEKLNKKNISFFFTDGGHGDMQWEKALPFLKQHNTPPALPSGGDLVFAGFLISQSFRLVADSPDVMARISYKTAPGGQLEYLQFSRAGNNAPLEKMIVEIPLIGDISGFHVTATGKAISLDCKKDFIRYTLSGEDSDWNIRVVE